MDTKALKKQMGAAIAMVLVAAVALGSATFAWFVSNTKVQADMSSVSATSATPNLLIALGDNGSGKAKTSGGKTSESVGSAAATALYPASTDDCKTWWAVNSWTNTTGQTLANGYYNPNPSESKLVDALNAGSYKQGNNTLNAYQVATYSVYTTTGEVELNLDPDSPIAVIAEGTPAETTGFKDALRVGIVVDGELKLVYAPTAETGQGNDSDAQTGYRTVSTESATKNATYQVVAGSTFTDWTAVSVTGGVYQKATNSLGKVGTSGSVVKVYVWLEGTDADCLVGNADQASDANTYKVALKFVGATATADK